MAELTQKAGSVTLGPAGSGPSPAARARRMTVSLLGTGGLLLPLISIVLALVTCGFLLAASGVSPVSTYHEMFSAAFGNAGSFGVTVERTIPPLLTALGVAVALRAGLWNIGGDGQIYVGAAAATAVVLYAPAWPFPLTLVFALIAGTVGGGAWAFIPGVLRAKRNISEVITSLMLVYIGEQVVAYLLSNPWSVPGATSPATNPFPARDTLPIIWGGTPLNAGVVAAVLAVVATWVLLDRTGLGLRLRGLGVSTRAARGLGLNVTRLTILAMVISGAFAGLAGSIDTLGYEGRLLQGFSPNWGFEAIAIALIGRLQPIGIVPAALLFGALDAGSAGLLTAGSGVSLSLAQLIEGVAVVYLLGAIGIGEALRRRRRRLEALAKVRSSHERELVTAGSGEPS